jgi:hypothetical protein
LPHSDLIQIVPHRRTDPKRYLLGDEASWRWGKAGTGNKSYKTL